MGGPVPEPLEGAATVGDGGVGGVEDRGNGAGAGYFLQDSRAVSVVRYS